MSVPMEKGDTSSNNSTPSTEMGSKDGTILVQQLKMQFHGTRKGDHETVKAYVKKLKSTADSLAAINNPVSDQDLVLQLLAGLPSQYLLLKNTISSRFPLPNFSVACSMLYEYEQSLLLQEKTSTPPPPNQSANLGAAAAAAENSNYNNWGKSTVEMIHDIASTATAAASIVRDCCKAFGWSEPPAPASRGKKKNTSGGGGRGNCKRGGGPSTKNCRNSGRK